jgi:hypothetical protein
VRFHIVAKDIQEQHITTDMHQTTVHKHTREQRQVFALTKELSWDQPILYDKIIKPLRRRHLIEKHEDIDTNNQIEHPRCVLATWGIVADRKHDIIDIDKLIGRATANP